MHLTVEIVEFIRDSYLAESKHTAKIVFIKRFASYFKVSNDVIRDIITYRTWKHVNCELHDPPVDALRSFEELTKLDPFEDEDIFKDWPLVFE